MAASHPDRVLAGAAPGRGLILSGLVLASRPSGASWEVDLQLADTAVTCRLGERPVTDGGELVLTALDPPLFGPDGAAIPAEVAGPRAAGAPGQARRGVAQ